MDVSSYVTQHREALGLAEQLQQKLQQAQLPIEEISKLLMEIGGKLKFHLSMEDSYVYPKALAAANSDLKAVAKKMQAEMVGISDAFGKYLTTWTKISILKDPAKFISDTKGILATLKRRIDLEEHDFYPLLHAHL